MDFSTWLWSAIFLEEAPRHFISRSYFGICFLNIWRSSGISIPSLCCRILSPSPFSGVPSPRPPPTPSFPRTLCSGLLLPSCGRNQELPQNLTAEPLGRPVRTILRKTVEWKGMQIMIWEAANSLMLACAAPWPHVSKKRLCRPGSEPLLSLVLGFGGTF